VFARRSRRGKDSRKGVLAALRAYQSCQALEALAHIVGARAKKRAWRDWRQSQGFFFGKCAEFGGKERSSASKVPRDQTRWERQARVPTGEPERLDGCRRIVLRRRDSARHQCLYRLNPHETLSAAGGCCKTKNRLLFAPMVTQRQIETYAEDVARKFRPLKGVLAALRAYQSCLALEALAHIAGARIEKCLSSVLSPSPVLSPRCSHCA
jgi:hypothetical protein